MVTLTSIELTPGSQSLPKGVTQQYEATGIYSDNSTQDLSDQVSWETSDPALASVSAEGVVTALAAGGPIEVIARLGDVSGSTALTVSNAALMAIDVTPASQTLPKGLKQQYTATGTYSDGSTLDISTLVSWNSSDAAIASIDSKGLATARNAGGPVDITATLDDLSNAKPLSVSAARLDSIAVTAASGSLAKGFQQTYTATGSYSDASTRDLSSLVSWASSDPTVATISNDAKTRGIASTHKTGRANISASLAGVVGAKALDVTAEVLQSITINAPGATLPKGLKQTYTATGLFSDGSNRNLSTQVLWSSSDATLASISNADGSKGELKAESVGGPVQILAALGNISSTPMGLSVTDAIVTHIEVSGDAATLPDGQTQQYKATATYSDNSTGDLSDQVTWSSVDETVASVSNAAGSKGLATALAVGSTTIDATLPGANATSVGKSLEVTAAVLQRIEVSAESGTLANGFELQYAATGIYSDGSTQTLTGDVTWTSSDETVASISNADGSRGLATALAVGSTTIDAALPDSDAVSVGKSLDVTAAVLQRIEVSADSDALANGFELQYTATGIYSDGSTQTLTGDVTWTSSDETVASISNADGSRGLATALAVGSTTIDAALPDSDAVSVGKSLDVTAAILQRIEVSADNTTLANGFELQYAATGIYSDGSTQTLTGDVTWTSSDETVASISNADGSKGLATALATGTTTIGAMLPGSDAVSVGKSLDVTDALLQRIEVSADSDTLANGFELQYTATGIYSDDSVLDLTESVTWQSSDSTVAGISNAEGSQGLASALAVGPTTISATLDTVSGERLLNVTSATLMSIEVSSDSDTLVQGLTQQYTATGIYSDDSTVDLTDAVTWSVDPTAIASISNADGSRGLLEALEVGAAEVFATFGSGGSAVSGSTPLDVNAATLQSLSVTPTDPTLPRGLTLQFTATGTYTDGTVLDLTTAVAWSSSDESSASISNAEGSEGLVTAIEVSATLRIGASLDGISGATDLQVTDATIVSISVTPADLNLPLNVRQQYTATAALSDGSTQNVTALATWSSSDTGVATISNADATRGQASTIAAGQTTLTATLSGYSVTPATAQLKVSNRVLKSLVVSPEATSCGYARTKQFTALATFEDDTTQDVTTLANWTSSNTKLVTIGLRTGLAKTSRPQHKAGDATVLARLSGFAGTATLTKLKNSNAACTDEPASSTAALSVGGTGGTTPGRSDARGGSKK